MSTRNYELGHLKLKRMNRNHSKHVVRNVCNVCTFCSQGYIIELSYNYALCCTCTCRRGPRITIHHSSFVPMPQ